MDDDTTQREIFARVVEHLVPEAFATPTRAHRVTRETAGPGYAEVAQAWTAHPRQGLAGDELVGARGRPGRC